MTSTILAIAMGLSISLCLGLIGGLILVIDAYKKLARLITDTQALQRMVTTHGDTQLASHGRLGAIEVQLAKLQQHSLHLQSLAAGYSSVENAASLLEESGIRDAERLALESGLTEREANLMIQLRSSFPVDATSPLNPESDSSDGVM